MSGFDRKLCTARKWSNRKLNVCVKWLITVKLLNRYSHKKEGKIWSLFLLQIKVKNDLFHVRKKEMFWLTGYRSPQIFKLYHQTHTEWQNGESALSNDFSRPEIDSLSWGQTRVLISSVCFPKFEVPRPRSKNRIRTIFHDWQCFVGGKIDEQEKEKRNNSSTELHLVSFRLAAHLDKGLNNGWLFFAFIVTYDLIQTQNFAYKNIACRLF